MPIEIFVDPLIAVGVAGFLLGTFGGLVIGGLLCAASHREGE